MENDTAKPAFSFGVEASARLGAWKHHSKCYKAPKLEYKKLADRPWQEESFELVKERPLWIANAPMAAGKTLLICALGYVKLVKDAKLRVMISVPQTVIADGFRSQRFELPNGQCVDWNVSARNDLCHGDRDPISNSTIKHTLQWLRRPASSELEDRVLLCSHAALVKAFDSDPQAFKDVLVVIDEAHHAACAESEELRVQNRLGAVVAHAVEGHMELGLTTATFFRSDTADIVPAMHLSKFVRYSLPIPEFLEMVQPFERFSYDFVLYEVSWLGAMTQLFAERIGKTIVYIPPVNSSASLVGKHIDTKLVLQAIAGCENPVIRDADKPVMKVRRGKRWIKVVNLVDERFRWAKKEAIFSAQRNGKAGAIDVIITLNMFREGANWEWADRAVIIGPRNSMVDLLQTLGRLFRRPEEGAKPLAQVVHLLSKGVDAQDADEAKKEIRTKLNDYLKAVFASMLLEQLFTVPNRRSSGPKEGATAGAAEEKPTLVELLGDVPSPEVLMAKILNDVMEWQQRNGSKDANALKAAFETITRDALEPLGLGHRAADVAASVWAACAKRTASVRGAIAKVLDADLISESPLGFALAYTTGMYGIKDIRDLRTKLRGAFIAWEDARAYARSLGLTSAKEWREHVLRLREQEAA